MKAVSHASLQAASWGEEAQPSSGVQIWVVVGTLHGCPFELLDSAERLGAIVRACVEASGLTLLHHHVHHFEPQGVTASAVLAESHIALHSWPEQGVLFVDIATCSHRAASQAAFQELCARVPHQEQRIRRLISG